MESQDRVPTTRRYTKEQKDQAVRLVRAIRKETGRDDNGDSLALYVLPKRHGKVAWAMPLLAAAHDSAQNFSALPFELIQAVPDSVSARLAHRPIHQDKKIPIGFGPGLLASA